MSSFKGPLRLTEAECLNKSERATKQAACEHLYGQEHVELVEAAAREWKRRANWAKVHKGIWNSWDYECEQQTIKS